MSFVVAAMRNRTFLCAAIIVNAVAVMLTDLIALFVAVYRRVAEYDEFRPLIQGFMFSLVVMTVIAHICNLNRDCSPFVARHRRVAEHSDPHHAASVGVGYRAASSCTRRAGH